MWEITPTAKAAIEATKNKKIGVIATEATVRSGEFTKNILTLDREVFVEEKEAQDFVQMVESGKIDEERIKETLSSFSDSGIDTLVLGCTHFGALKDEISKALPSVTLISSTYEAVKKIANAPCRIEEGKTYYL